MCIWKRGTKKTALAIGTAATLALTGCADFGTGPQEKPDTYKPLVPIEHYEDGQTNQQQTPTQNQSQQTADEWPMEHPEYGVKKYEIQLAECESLEDYLGDACKAYYDGWYPIYVNESRSTYEIGYAHIILPEGVKYRDRSVFPTNLSFLMRDPINIVFGSYAMQGYNKREVGISSILETPRGTPGYSIND